MVFHNMTEGVGVCPPQELACLPKPQGGVVQHLERTVKCVTHELGHTLPTATSFRKEVEINNKRLHMTH